MRNILLIFTFFLTDLGFAQSGLPDFLHGTWKVENREVYEHWDRLNDNSLKGFSYHFKNGQMTVSEYVDIYRTENEIIYTAAVLNQNQGKGIDFKLVKTDSAFIFENPDHDFPKRISYQKITDTEVFVRVSGENQKGFAYKMKKQPEKGQEMDTTISNPNYDHVLANKLGADDYGMKSYILVILKTGTNQTTDKTLINNGFRGHLDNIGQLVKEEKMVVAGPFSKNDHGYRGIFILNVTSIEEAEKLLQTDPAIQEGLLAVELFKWYGSAALPEYLKYSDKIWKLKP
ncbi:MAG: DUF6265 family protein [Bacteroidales bacterium]|nr:DUF6265 family protein [Bacteroidales bacterium]